MRSSDASVADWLTPRNHNFLRLTRILKSLSIVDAAPLARALLQALEQIVAERPSIAEERTLEYWRQAVPPH
jgi:Mg-chelatase subunit ChlD